ncbi:Ig-like domain-containing protein [Clostridium sp. 001]|uniref:Ig-like domain-containing protein n=1 Tax=Clostridium sp. 001 TaxID=1970093 RepID=UPI001C2C7227|nr:Ig-like domain-containing protein [Clostridium sp. 001]QXE17564.1 hypothetical protein B5S50_01145 [Clostridium sp. 001]
MKKIWKKVSFVMMLIFTLMTFAPYPVIADTQAASTPSLTEDKDGNYTVSSVQDLNKLREDIDKGIDYSGKNVLLTQDIDVGKSELPLKSFTTQNTFNGTFNGKFHTISNYNDPKSGLFNIINKDGIVENARIDANVVIEGDKIENYGLIANEASGTIIRCSSTGTITNKVKVFFEAGIVARDTIGQTSSIAAGYLKDCYSNVIIDNQSSEEMVGYAGICSMGGEQLDHCYFYGEFTGNYTGEHSDKCQPILCSTYYDSKTGVTTSAENCAYDKDVLGYTPSSSDNGNPKGYTTAEMKNKDTYTALDFDFDKTWKIDSSNNGYPYLNSENTQKTAAKVTVDVQVTADDKTYIVPTSPIIYNTDDSLKTTATFKIVPRSDEDKELISKYNVSVTYSGDVFLNAPTIGDVPIDIDTSKVKINYNSNEDYQFVLGKVLPSTAKLLDNGAAGPTQDEQKQQIEDAKKAEDILYTKLGTKLGIAGDVPEFSWGGDKSAAPGKEETVTFSDEDWGIFSSARSGYKGIRAGYYDDWFKSIQTGLQKMKDAGVTARDVKMTEWEKLVLAITAIGYDPRDIKAYDLIDIISNKEYVKASNQYFTPQYAIYALTSRNYINLIPNDGKHITKDDLDGYIHEWAKGALGSKGADGSAVIGNTTPDMWTMKLQPIAAYCNPDAKPGDKYYDVKQAMDHVFAQFSNAQTYKGSFWGGSVDLDGKIDLNNAWTNAQVYMTLGMAHANIFDKMYIKDGKTILDGVLEKFDVKNGTTDFDNSSYESAQICRGLDSLVRAAEGRVSIFDCTDVKDSTVPVNNAIAALPDVYKITSADKEKVDAARAAYDELSDVKKASIKQETMDKLTDAEKKLSQSQPVKVTGIGLDKTSADLMKGDTLQLTAAITPKYATNTKIDWSSSDPTVASVDENGKVTALKKGTAVITAVSEDNRDAKAQCTITIKENVSVTGIILDKTSVKLIPKAALQLTPTITPNDATNQKVDWSSSDPAVAAVDKSGKVTAIKVGTATITANTEDGNKTASCAVTVVDGQGAIVINNVKLKNKLALAAGKDSDYEGYFTPDDLASIKGTIDLSNLDITDSDMDVMKYLKGVSAINLSDNKDLTNLSFKKLKFDWTIPKGLDFSGCTGMKDIKNKMFAFTSSKLTSIKLPEGIPSIPFSCFSNSKLLASVEISNTVKSVGNLAFSGCTSLEYMKIPGSVTQLGGGCFSGCTNLSVLDLTDTSFTKDNTKDTKYPDSTTIICGKSAKLSPGQISIKTGGVKKIANEIPSDKGVVWGSTDANVAKVSSEGVITGVNPGTAYIYAKTDFMFFK